MSALLEHLLDGDELVPKRDGPMIIETSSLNETPAANENPPANESSSVNETPPANESPSANEPPSIDEAPSVNETPPASERVEPRPSDPSDRQPDTAASSARRSAFATSTGEAEPRENKTNSEPPFSADFPGPMGSSLPPSASSPIIFVGFGTGANSLLHLAVSSRLSVSPSSSGDCLAGAGDDRSSSGAGVEGGGGHARGSFSDMPEGGGCGGGESRSPLALALQRSALHVGGLVLINGFVSLENQASKVRGAPFLVLMSFALTIATRVIGGGVYINSRSGEGCIASLISEKSRLLRVFSRPTHLSAYRSDSRSPKRSVKDKKAYTDSQNLNRSTHQQHHEMQLNLACLSKKPLSFSSF